MIGAAESPAVDESPSPQRPSIRHRVRRMSANFWLSFMFWWTQYCPPVVLFTRPFFLWFAWRYAKGLREGTLANAARILGPESTQAEREALAKEVIRNFYLSVYELGKNVRMTRAQLEAKVDDVVGRQNWDDVRAHGGGVVVVTAHLGGFELGMVSLTQQERRVHVVYHHDAVARFDRLRSRLRKKIGVMESAVDDGWSLWIRLRDALVAGEVVVLQADRIMPGQQGVWVPFMGGHIELPAGPIKLAIASGAAIVPIFSIRTAPGRVKVVIEEPIRVTREDGPVNEAHPAIRRIAAVVEAHVRANPAQWSMVYPVWREDLNDASAES